MSALLAGVIVFVFSFFPVIFGMEARLQGIAADPNRNVMIDLLRGLEPFTYYLFVCAIIAAISSTADAVLCAIGSNVVEDFLLFLPRGHADRAVGILLSRIVILLVGIVALMVSYQVNDILGLLSVSYEISISCLFVPVLFALFTKKTKFEAAAVAMIMGIFGFFCFRFFPLPFLPKELAAVLLSFMGYGLGYLYTKLYRYNA